MKPYNVALLLIAVGTLAFFFGKGFLDGSQPSASEIRPQLSTHPQDEPRLPSERGNSQAGLRPAARSTVDLDNPKIGFFHPGEKISSKGMLTTAAADQLQLTNDQRYAAQLEISAFWKRTADSLASRAQHDPEASDAGRGIDVFRIPAAEDRGNRSLSQFKASLAAIAGENASENIVASLPRHTFAGFGKYDVTLKFSPDESRLNIGRTGADSIKAEYSYMDPETGATILTATSSWSGFVDRFGEWNIQH